MEKAFDCLIIGAGPVSLVEALVRARLGQSVALVDAGPVLGGAWRTHHAFGVDGVETAPHVLLPHPLAHRAMLALVPGEYIDISADARFVVTRNPLLPDHSVPLVSGASFYLSWALVTRLTAPGATRWAALRGFLGMLARRLRDGPAAWKAEGALAPARGLDAWMRCFQAELDRLGVVSHLGRDIRRIRTDGAGIVAEGATGEVWRAKRLVITRNAVVERVGDGSEDIELPRGAAALSYLALLLRGPRGGGLRVMHGHPRISLLNDTTDMLPVAFQTRHPGCRVAAIRCAGHADPAPPEQLMADLQAMRWLSPDAALVDVFRQRVEQPGPQRAAIVEMRRLLGSRLTVLPFGDFGLSSTFLRAGRRLRLPG